MAPADSTEEFMSDALGEYFFIGPSAGPSKSQEHQSSPSSPSCSGVGVFTFPVRSSKATSSAKQFHSVSHVEATCTLAAADATATLVLFSPKQAADRGGFWQEKDTDDMKANPKPAEANYGQRVYGRSTSLDTATPQRSRDQSTTSNNARSDADESAKASCSFSSPDDPCLNSQCMAARRSGSLGGSGGGAGPAAPHHHHGFWQSTEWWRSFSSSRLNEMAEPDREEADKRSPEMRKVPYVGGAEPMCSLVHGEGSQ